MAYAGIISRYHDLLDIPSHTKRITLHEGNTPLIPLPRLADELGGVFELYIKFEGLNPSGSFKDRGMTVAISEAVGNNMESVICASTGNTAASAAAYAAHAGLKSFVLIPKGNVAIGKLAGAIAYGATVLQIEGSFDDALSLVSQISKRMPIALVNSLNPYRLEGQKTAAFEICDSLGSAPDMLCLPVGNAGNITSYWMGFKRYNDAKKTGLPVLLGVQADGAAPLVLGHPVDKPETIATAIRIGRPARGEQALSAAAESSGKIISVSDALILQMQKLLASHGLWVEPASAAGLAGLYKDFEKDPAPYKGKRIVIVCTGHGLKDPDVITRNSTSPIELPAEIHAVEKAIKGDRV